MASLRFGSVCSRCGMCCLAKVCPIGQRVYGVGEGVRCPGLSFEGDVASCALADLVPTGDGCCISARVFVGGVEYDFAGLSADLKVRCVREVAHVE